MSIDLLVGPAFWPSEWPAQEINDHRPVSGPCLLTPEMRIQCDVIGILSEFAHKFFVSFQSCFSALLSMVLCTCKAFSVNYFAYTTLISNFGRLTIWSFMKKAHSWKALNSQWCTPMMFQWVLFARKYTNIACCFVHWEVVWENLRIHKL